MSNKVEDWQIIHSVRYLFEDLNNEEGMEKVAELTGLPMGVVVSAFGNFFPDGWDKHQEN